MAADRLACFGGAADQGYSICALAEGGTLFSWAASPGRGEASDVASILTGLPESEHGVGHAGQEFLLDALTTVAEDLRDGGYATAAFVTSPRVNVSRRLDQGFDLYDDRLASPSRSRASAAEDLPQRIADWIEVAPAPWFIWVHANRDAGLIELERLLSRLSQTLDSGQNAPGILFTSLRGEREAENLGLERTGQRITWRTHRVPLIWRPPLDDEDRPPRVSRRLASLLDVAPTLRAAARVSGRVSSVEAPEAQTAKAEAAQSIGRDLGRLARIPTARTNDPERFVLLRVPDPEGEVGLASRNHLYTRRSSPLDGSGRPVPMASLAALKARFASIPMNESTSGSTARTARLDIGLWRTDILDTDSPAPRLEFHLARGRARSRGRSTTRPPRPDSSTSPELHELRGKSE
jgi:hypothetical protein